MFNFLLQNLYLIYTLLSINNNSSYTIDTNTTNNKNNYDNKNDDTYKINNNDNYNNRNNNDKKP